MQNVFSSDSKDVTLGMSVFSQPFCSGSNVTCVCLVRIFCVPERTRFTAVTIGSFFDCPTLTMVFFPRAVSECYFGKFFFQTIVTVNCQVPRASVVWNKTAPPNNRQRLRMRYISHKKECDLARRSKITYHLLGKSSLHNMKSSVVQKIYIPFTYFIYEILFPPLKITEPTSTK